jgi:TolB-like protein/DNA-binding winged helix-turn-helix (wHTH) protein/Tfp pilus assembly protein PilF
MGLEGAPRDLAGAAKTSEDARDPRILHFGPYELDLTSREVRKDGAVVRLRHQPFTVLALLASQPGRVFSREEIQRAVWGEETHVDYEQGINYCIKEIRAAIGDSAESPSYVETLARRGYRFIAPVRTVGVEERPARVRGRSRLVAGLAVLATAGVLAAAAAARFLPAREAKTPPSPERLTIAVLPFENLSGDRGQDYFSEGLTEETIAQLGRLQPGRLSVISRTVARDYAGRGHSVDTLGQELGVDFVLEGSVRQSAGRVTVVARLIRAGDKRQVWTETFEAELRDIVDVQNRVALAVAGRIQLTLSPGEQARLRSPPRVDPRAYRLYLRGRYFWNKWSVPALRRSVELFEEAVRAQPAYALAHAGLADAYIALADQSPENPRETLENARSAARRALEIDGSLAEAHAALGMVLGVHEFAWSEAERELLRAIDLNPSYPTARHWYSHVLRAEGRLDEALAQLRIAEESAPLSLIVAHNLGMVRLHRGELDLAVRRFETVLELDPDFAPALMGLGRAYLAGGKRTEAVEALERAARVTRSNPRYEASLAYAYAVTGRADDGRRILARLSHGGSGRAYDIATIQAGLGDAEAALASLDRAYAAKDPALRGLLVDERLQTLRARPQWPALVAAMGLSHRAVANQ